MIVTFQHAVSRQGEGFNNEPLCKIMEAVGMDGSESVLIRTVTRGRQGLSLRAFPNQRAEVVDPAPTPHSAPLPQKTNSGLLFVQ